MKKERGERHLTMETVKLLINKNRLERMIDELGQFGLNDKGGLDRTTFTDQELMARDWLKDELSKINLELHIDAAANIWGRRPGTVQHLPSIVFGSHIDTVPNGGKYDGALGVLIALEIMKVLQENHIQTRHPLELVSFSAEEPNPFGLSTFGSRAVTGKIKSSDLEDVRDGNGQLLTEALKSAGGDPERFESAVRNKKELSAYLEVHIEQGKRLLNRNIPIGIVTGITGIYREKIIVQGTSNHAGTTIMTDRQDALAATSEIILFIEKICRNHPSEETVGTIGQLDVFPNALNIIPGTCELFLEIRGSTEQEMKDLIQQLGPFFEDVSRRRNIRLERKIILNQKPVDMDEIVIDTISNQVNGLQIPFYLLGSMAGHDATHMASITKAGMIFVPSIDGKSHCPEEKSRMEDIEKAANAMLYTILELDKILDNENRGMENGTL